LTFLKYSDDGGCKWTEWFKWRRIAWQGKNMLYKTFDEMRNYKEERISPIFAALCVIWKNMQT